MRRFRDGCPLQMLRRVYVRNFRVTTRCRPYATVPHCVGANLLRSPFRSAGSARYRNSYGINFDVTTVSFLATIERNPDSPARRQQWQTEISDVHLEL